MPTSYPHQISTIVDLIVSANPKSLLDVGIGFGKYGMLSREYLELWDNTRGSYDRFERRIDGVEAFGAYVTPLHEYIYSNIYLGNALDLLDTIDHHYDLALLIDVLEHFTKPDGERLLAKLLAKADVLILSTPKYPIHQGAVFENPYETHRSRWTKSELGRLANAFFVSDPMSYILCAGTQNALAPVRRSFRRLRWKRLAARVPASIPAYRFLAGILRRGS